MFVQFEDAPRKLGFALLDPVNQLCAVALFRSNIGEVEGRDFMQVAVPQTFERILQFFVISFGRL